MLIRYFFLLPSPTSFPSSNLPPQLYRGILNCPLESTTTWNFNKPSLQLLGGVYHWQCPPPFPPHNTKTITTWICNEPSSQHHRVIYHWLFRPHLNVRRGFSINLPCNTVATSIIVPPPFPPYTTPKRGWHYNNQGSDGDGIDNDCDGKIDEEAPDGKDDDGDGDIDEDTRPVSAQNTDILALSLTDTQKMSRKDPSSNFLY